jgi:hypothetical protein
MGHTTEAGFFGHILECAVSHVAEQDVAATGACDEQALSATIVVIGEGGGDTYPIAQPHAGPLGNILERPIAFVPVKCVGSELIHEVNIVMAITIVVADGHAAAVIVQVHLEFFPLLTRQKPHAEMDARLASQLAKAILRRSLVFRGRIKGLAPNPCREEDHSHDYQEPGQTGDENPTVATRGSTHESSSRPSQMWTSSLCGEMHFGNHRRAMISPTRSGSYPWINLFEEALVDAQNLFPFIVVEIGILAVRRNNRQPKVGRYRAQRLKGLAVPSLLTLLG